METSDKSSGDGFLFPPFLQALLVKMVEVSGTSNEQLRNQEETSKRHADMLIQHGEVLKQQGELLKNQGTTMERLADTVEKQYATLDLKMQSHVYYLQESQEKGFKKLQDQIDAMKIKGSSTNNNAGSGPRANTHVKVPESGGRRETRKCFKLGFRKAAIRKIEDIKAKDRIGTLKAMKEVLKMRKFADVKFRNLKVWWGQKSDIVRYLRRHPDQANSYRMTKSSRLGLNANCFFY